MAEPQRQPPASTTQTAGIDPATLQAIIGAVAAELRKPTELEQEELEDRKRKRDKENEKIAQANADRRENAHLVRQQIELAERRKKICLHKGGRPEHPYTVFVQDAFGGYILCQGCQAVIRPSVAIAHYPKGYKGSVIFDSTLFNSLFQGTSDSGIFA